MKDSSTNIIIPANELTHYRTWVMGELNSTRSDSTSKTDFTPFKWHGESGSAAFVKDSAETLTYAQLSPESAEEMAQTKPKAEQTLSYPTPAELDAIHQEAWQKGYEAGVSAGQAAGFTDGQTAGLAAAHTEAESKFTECWAPLRSLADSISQSLSAFESQLSGELLKLSVTFAEHLVANQLNVDPTALLPILREVLSQLPTTLPQGRIKVHPDDLNVARTFLAHETPSTVWQWVEDAEIERGGCIVETPQLKLDATLTERLCSLKTTLGLEAEYASR